ncbi:MAG TPA: hypothetical protein PLE74_02880 [Candidatus Cloacimonadota bacterium]|mgnify:CR=1 FL=1|nr:hypothetical protein [Candidatus Cloacimonadota bacterium]HPT71205.1 hypothetical protein [Candidatus Cloacimonadota bacterium]
MDKKKEVAAISAVLSYLQSESATAAGIATVAPTLPTYWALYGRQQIMANRDLVQRRVIKR